MGFYIRKGFNFGPLRLNLSKSGLGFSVGVKGARVGIGPRGSYLHAGRGGFYLRQQLGGGGQQSQRMSAPPAEPAVEMENEEHEGVIDSIHSDALAHDAHTDLLEALDNVRTRTPRVRIALRLGALLLAGATLLWLYQPSVLPTPAYAALMAVLLLGVVIGCLLGRRADQRNGSVSLTFNLEPDAEARYTALYDALCRFAASDRVWLIDRKKGTDDWKRNAGASNLVTRHPVQPSETCPKHVESNLPVMAFPAGQQTLYFFASGIFVYDAHGVGIVPYNNLQVEVGEIGFTEEETPPSDAPVVGQTWRYVNKRGGPDRRFNDNREIPILRYGTLSLSSTSGLNELFYASNPTVVEPVAVALRALRGLDTTTRTQQ
jgi:hypothetical protein